jgi:HK97 family phage prohead protease
MTNTKTDTPLDVRALRAAHVGMPGGAGRVASFPTKLRGSVVTLNGKQFFEVDGYATVFNKAYKMWDEFGPFNETADGHMLDASMARNPDVAFLLNHKGTTMARTKNGSLDLAKDEFGLKIHALLNIDRTDVRDLASAISDNLIDEMSFAFLLLDGEWSEDYTEFRILEADINRGDVSAVNFGANPYTSIGARAQDFFRTLGELPTALRAEAVSTILTADDSTAVMRAAVNLTRASGDRYKRAALDMSGVEGWDIEDLTGDAEDASTGEFASDADKRASKTRLEAMVASDDDDPADKQSDGKTEDSRAASAADTVTLYANRWEMVSDDSV